jgi:nucleotide-binding universal stress UspA family protein
MFEKALFATDLSAASFAMVNCSCLGALGRLGTEECVLSMCIDGGTYDHKVFEEARLVFKEWLQKQKVLLEKQWLKTEIAVCGDPPARGIPRLAERKRCFYIILGDVGHGIAKDILLGSVALEVLHNSTVPVLLFHVEADGKIPETAGCCPATGDILDHVLFPTDFSPNAEHAFRYLLEIAEKGARKITLLHIQEDRRIIPHLEHKLEEFNQIDSERLEGLKRRINEVSEAKVQISLDRGHASGEILKTSREDSVSMIVMGTRGRGNVGGFFVGSVSHNVARHASIPLLLVPEPEGA